MRDKRFSNYAAAVSALTVGASAQASPLPVETTVGQGTESGPGFFQINQPVDLDGNGTLDIWIYGFLDTNDETGYVGVYGYSGTSNYVASTYYGGNVVVERYAPADSIGESLSYGAFINLFRLDPDGGNGYPGFLDERGFMGVRLRMPGEETFYACVQMEVTTRNGLGFEIRGGLYEDQPDTPVTCPDFADEIFADRFSDQ